MINREDEKEILYEAVKNHIVELALHPKGNYVLIPVLKLYKGPIKESMVEQLFPYIDRLALDKQSVCILNQIIEETINIDHITKIVDELAKNITEIIQSPFGNYSITKALEVININIYNTLYIDLGPQHRVSETHLGQDEGVLLAIFNPEVFI